VSRQKKILNKITRNSQSFLSMVISKFTSKYALNYFKSAISDFILIYYFGYLVFAFLGYFFHPFFYCYHMVDIIIRNQYLVNVLKALYRPRYELLNTLILFLCMEYIFTIIEYVGFF